jgi:hypothetical protein
MHTSGKKAAFVVLDAAFIVILFSMAFCMRPMRFDFISEAMRQCQADERARVLPILLGISMALVVVLQLDWMYRVSLHHLQHVAKLEVVGVWKLLEVRPEAAAPDATRTNMVGRMLTCRAKTQIVCVDGHSDAAFVSSFAAIVGIAAVVRWDWKSPEGWLHFYGVFLFCAGYFAMLQIVWLNLQRVSTVASLMHMPPVRGMHWLIDSAIILFLLIFLMLNFMLGETGPLVVASEFAGFALLLFQFLYVFQACCRCSHPLVLQRPAAWSTRGLVCALLLLPFVCQFVKWRMPV